jgi:hypothetical protein
MMLIAAHFYAMGGDELETSPSIGWFEVGDRILVAGDFHSTIISVISELWSERLFEIPSPDRSGHLIAFPASDLELTEMPKAGASYIDAYMIRTAEDMLRVVHLPSGAVRVGRALMRGVVDPAELPNDGKVSPVNELSPVRLYEPFSCVWPSVPGRERLAFTSRTPVLSIFRDEPEEP